MAIPDGASTRLWRGEKYATTKETLQRGRLIKLYAKCTKAKDHVSFNYYRLASGDRLKPCEMPEAKAVDFVCNSAAQ